MGLHAGGKGEGEGEGGGYTRGNNEISNFNFSCNVNTTQQLMVSPDQSKGQICRFHGFHFSLHPHPHQETFVEGIALQGETFLLKMASVKLATVT